MNRYRLARRLVATAMLLMLVFLFVDISGVAHRYLAWMARVQWVPALLMGNALVLVILALLSLVVGRIYCSVICPLGIYQDVLSALRRRLWERKRGRKSPLFRYRKPLSWLRYGVLTLFVLLLALGLAGWASWLDPYGIFGRFAQTLLAPVYRGLNNLLALVAEHYESYAFYSADIWLRSGVVLAISTLVIALISYMAYRYGRLYCNTVCPVGTFLGLLSRVSLFRMAIDPARCNGCTACQRRCKSSCIDAPAHAVDASRCVMCFDCLDACRRSAIGLKFRYARPGAVSPEGPTSPDDKPRKSSSDSFIDSPVDQHPDPVADPSRRRFLATSAAVAAGAALSSSAKTVDGGLAVIEARKIPRRHTPILPPGAQSLAHFTRHCTACQLCVAQCPNGVLRPSESLSRLMQPESSYERGHCRPECTRCSQVCPAGAILPVSHEEKSSIQIGHAVWVRENCIPLTDGASCGNCARHCPTGAITMVSSDPTWADAPKIPVVNAERCIGCGACEHLCPARPYAAIYVEGHEVHRTL